jgi:hypothetical protein
MFGYKATGYAKEPGVGDWEPQLQPRPSRSPRPEDAWRLNWWETGEFKPKKVREGPLGRGRRADASAEAEYWQFCK